MIENKLGIENRVELSRTEERISKKKAVEMFDTGYLNEIKAGKFESLAKIHKYLFDEIYDFVGSFARSISQKGILDLRC